MTVALETRGLCKSFGALTVAQNIDFRLRPGDRHALIGPNGAGKTTFVNMLMGALRPSSGRILLGGDDVTRAPQAQRVKRGLGRTFQINSLFRNLPVLDNVALAVAERRGMAPRMWRAASSYADIKNECTELLDPRLSKAFKLSGSGQLKANLDVYNVTNSSAVLGNNFSYGPRWLFPTPV